MGILHIFVNKSGTTKIIKNRHMTKTMSNWTFSGENEYVLPLYADPVLTAWRTDELKSLGINKLPKTYNDVQKVATLLKSSNSKKVVWSDSYTIDPTGYQRWFDFFPLYYAASNGAEFINGNKFEGNEKAGIKSFTFANTLYKEGQLVTQSSTDPFERGNSLMTFVAPSTIPTWNEKYKNLVYGKTYKISNIPVPNSMKNAKNIKTYSDAKGVVIYSKATTAQRKAAIKFLSYVYSSSTNDLKLMKTTDLLPARDDLSTNKEFKSYFNKNKELKVYAKYIPYSIPSMNNKNYNDLQETLGNKGWIPALKGSLTPKKAWNTMEKALKEAL